MTKYLFVPCLAMLSIKFFGFVFTQFYNFWHFEVFKFVCQKIYIGKSSPSFRLDQLDNVSIFWLLTFIWACYLLKIFLFVCWTGVMILKAPIDCLVFFWNNLPFQLVFL